MKQLCDHEISALRCRLHRHALRFRRGEFRQGFRHGAAHARMPDPLETAADIIRERIAAEKIRVLLLHENIPYPAALDAEMHDGAEKIAVTEILRKFLLHRCDLDADDRERLLIAEQLRIAEAEHYAVCLRISAEGCPADIRQLTADRAECGKFRFCQKIAECKAGGAVGLLREIEQPPADEIFHALSYPITG